MPPTPPPDDEEMLLSVPEDRGLHPLLYELDHDDAALLLWLMLVIVTIMK